MADREKVIKGLECCERTDGEQCKNCPYTDSDICVEEMSKDALELLKEQEAVKPNRGLAKTQTAWFCGACGFRLNRAGRFCSKCGKAVKWK